MKDLGKIKSPVKEMSVLKLFENIENGGVGDDDQQFTEQVMDKHLSEFESDRTGQSSTICDIAQYMANLKEKHMESELKLEISNKPDRISSCNESKNIAIVAQTIIRQMNEDQQQPSQSSGEDDSSLIVIDARIDKVFKSYKTSKNIEPAPKRILKSPRQSIQLSRSPDRTKSISNSPVKIIKVHSSARSSMDSGKRSSNTLSRDNSKERIVAHQTSPKMRRSSEGGILKTSYTTQDCAHMNTGILKRNSSPMTQSRSPERSRRSLSPKSSFDTRSPDRNHLSPHSSFDTRSPDRKSNESCYADLSFGFASPRSFPIRSNQSSFESRSPDRDHKRSLSAHSSFIKSRSPEPNYQYFYPDESYHMHSPERKGKRLSKSLERSTSRESNSSYRYGLSPERIYGIDHRLRSQSAENPHAKQSIHMSRSNESLTRSIEQPTCVECLYQKKPS